MKQINVWFDDEEHAKLIDAKGDLSWHDFIMQLAEQRKKQEGNRK